MKLSLSVRVAEALSKTSLNVPFADILALAVAHGYQGVCLRASAGGVQTSRSDLVPCGSKLRTRDSWFPW